MLSAVSKGKIFIKNKGILMRRCSSSSIIKERVEFFNDKSATWWDFNGSMKQMHLAHPKQISFIRHQLPLKDGSEPEAGQPLSGYKIAEVGCGVGMNSEGLALLGAEVTGLDPAKTTIEAARAHAASNPNLEGKLRYLVSTAEDHALTHSGHYDAVMAFFVLEHIRNRQEFIDNCLALLKPNGSLFISHGNRSFLMSCYILWHMYVTGLFNKSLIYSQTLLTHEEMTRMVNRGHPCELKDEQRVYWTLDGQSFRGTRSKKFLVFSHFVRKL